MPLAPHQDPLPQFAYLRPIFFGITSSTVIFVTAGYFYDRNLTRFYDRIHGFRSRLRQAFFGARDRLTLEQYLEEKRQYFEERRLYFMERKREMLARAEERLAQLRVVPVFVQRTYLMILNQIASMTEAERTLAPLIGLNLVVFGCWQIPRLAPFMTRWFLHHPTKGNSITLLTSCFSHQEILHLGLNMVGLWSFGSIMHDVLGREQFLALYLTTGIGANVASHVLSLASRRWRPLLPSLGASGALYGLLASTAVLYPHSSVYIAFLPFIPIQLG